MFMLVTLAGIEKIWDVFASEPSFFSLSAPIAASTARIITIRRQPQPQLRFEELLESSELLTLSLNSPKASFMSCTPSSNCLLLSALLFLRQAGHVGRSLYKPVFPISKKMVLSTDHKNNTDTFYLTLFFYPFFMCVMETTLT